MTPLTGSRCAPAEKGKEVLNVEQHSTGVVQRAWRSSDPRNHTLFMDVAYEEGVVRAAFWDFEL